MARGQRIPWRVENRPGERLFLLLAVTLWSACSGDPVPVVKPLLETAEKIPVVFVPGITGVELLDAETGKIIWGNGSSLLRPRDRGYATARSLVELDRGDRVIPGRVLRRIHLAGIIRKTVYQSLVNLFEANGYRSGDLAAPQAGGNFFLFSYDWRQDNVESAQLLGRRLEALRRTHGNARLPVVLICQSNGAHLCRYFVKYGSAPLEVAESGQATAAPKIEVQKVVLAGASNGGSLRILRELNRGRKYIRWIGRRWSPETLFTFVSLYQDLPAYTQDLFVDAHGKPLAIDLYDASAWVKHGWSIYGRAAAGRLRGRTTPELFGSAQRRRDFLRLALDRAKRFQRVLHRDVEGFGPTRFYLIENDFNETPARAMLLRNGGGWQTYFSGDRELAKCPAAAAAANAPGDGHATLVSQRWLSPQELEQMDQQRTNVEGEHFEMILSPETQRRLIEIVAAPNENSSLGRDGH